VAIMAMLDVEDASRERQWQMVERGGRGESGASVSRSRHEVVV
jgi:hypothetical protein